jgi:hypothetical protein
MATHRRKLRSDSRTVRGYEHSSAVAWRPASDWVLKNRSNRPKTPLFLFVFSWRRMSDRDRCMCHGTRADVKAENMLLDRARRTLKIIADFGVARVEAGSDMTGQTGTLGYMAPEMLLGHTYDHKCDVYSFGILLWETYCCAMAYPNYSLADISYHVVKLVRDRPTTDSRSISLIYFTTAAARLIIDHMHYIVLLVRTCRGSGRTSRASALARWWTS